MLSRTCVQRRRSATSNGFSVSPLIAVFATIVSQVARSSSAGDGAPSTLVASTEAYGG